MCLAWAGFRSFVAAGAVVAGRARLALVTSARVTSVTRVSELSLRESRIANFRDTRDTRDTKAFPQVAENPITTRHHRLWCRTD